MEDTAKNKEIVMQLAQLLDEHNGANTIVLYIGNTSSWTDYFIITTISSSGHLKGILRHLRSFMAEKSIEPLHRHRKIDSEKWVLIDCGNFVVHLMDREMRDFYELERLWHSGDILYHSSKSS